MPSGWRRCWRPSALDFENVIFTRALQSTSQSLPCRVLKSNWNGWRPWAIGAAVLALSALVFDALRGLLREVSYAEVVQQIATQPASDLLLAGLATALSYLVLTGYDFSALKYAGAQGPPHARSCSHRSSRTHSVTRSVSAC